MMNSATNRAATISKPEKYEPRHTPTPLRHRPQPVPPDPRSMRTSKGIKATPTAAAIKSYIQSLWGSPNSPEYVLLIGDTDTIPAWTGGGDSSSPTDLPPRTL